MKERELISKGLKEIVFGCHCYEFKGNHYAFYEDGRVRYSTAKQITKKTADKKPIEYTELEGLSSLPINCLDWKSSIPKVHCIDCPFFKSCEYMDSEADIYEVRYLQEEGKI